MKKLTLIIISTLLLFSISCSKKDSSSTPKIVAKIDGNMVVLKKEFNQIYDAQIKMLKMQNKEVKKEDVATMKQSVLDGLILQKILEKKVGEEKIVVEKKTVEGKIEDIKKSFPSQKEFEENLKKSNLTTDELKKRLELQLKISKLLEDKILKDVKVDDKEAKKYFKDNTELFISQEEIKASHILLKMDKDTPKADADKKKNELKKIRADIMKNKKTFAEKAKKFSEDGSAEKGGDLGYFPKGAMVPEFEKIAFNTKVGGISKVFRSPFGWHILKVEDKKAARKYEYKEVETNLKDYLLKKKRTDVVNKYLKKIKDGSKVETFI